MAKVDVITAEEHKILDLRTQDISEVSNEDYIVMEAAILFELVAEAYQRGADAASLMAHLGPILGIDNYDI